MHQFEETEDTLEDLMALPEGERAELIDGVIRMMAPAANKHSLAATRLSARIDTYFEENREKGPTGSDSWVIISEAWTNYDKHNSFVHDIAGFSRKDLPQRPETGPIKAKPVWVCEILSPSNWSHDTQHKRVVLEYHKIPFYWLVDPSKKAIQVFELKSGSEHYQITCSVDDKSGMVHLAPFENLSLDLTRIFNY